MIARGVFSPIARWLGTLIVVVTGLYLLTEVLPGDFADSAAGPDPQRAEALRAQRGLDAPVLLRLVSWWTGVFHGDLGTSLIDETPVLPRVLTRMALTLAATIPAAVLAVVLAAVTALILAWWRGRIVGTQVSVLVSLLTGLPEIVLIVGLVLLLSAAAQLVPPVSLPEPGQPVWADPSILLLPVLCLALPNAAWGARMLRGSADDLLSTDLVVAARRRGAPAFHILTAHVLPRWLEPVTQVAALLSVGVLGGTAIVESLLAYPGAGQALVAAVSARDTPMVQGLGLVIVGISLAVLLIADLLTSRTRLR